MNMTQLQENLRRHLLAKIERGELTGLALANRAGFRQAHISNFLNRKRGLSLEGMDRILNVLQLGVVDLIPATELVISGTFSHSEQDYENVPLVASELADRAIISKDAAQEVLKFKRSFLKRLRPDLASDRQHWERFVLIKAANEDGLAMYPRLQPNATVLIDRHYNSLAAYRKTDRTMYAVRRESGKGSIIRYVEHHGRQLTLRPQNDDCTLEFISINSGRTFADYIIGRIAHISIET